MRSPDERPLRATSGGRSRASLLFACLSAPALLAGACGPRSAAVAPPLPEVVLDASVRPPLMSVSGCAWATPRAGEDEAPVECSLVLLRDSKVLALTWIARAGDGREVGRGGSGGLPWTSAGEERRVRFTFQRSAAGPVASITVEPL